MPEGHVLDLRLERVHALYGDPAVCSPPVIQHVDDGTRNIHGHCGRDYRDQVLCGVTLSKP